MKQQNKVTKAGIAYSYAEPETLHEAQSQLGDEKCLALLKYALGVSEARKAAPSKAVPQEYKEAMKDPAIKALIDAEIERRKAEKK